MSPAVAEVHSIPVLGGCTVPILCNPGPATAGNGIILNSTPLPVLRVTGMFTPAGSATVSLSNGPPGAPFLIAASGAPGYQAGGPLFLGEILIDPVNWFPLLSGNLSGTGDFSVTLPLAGIAPTFFHLPVFLQGIVLDPGGTYWRVSNATVATIRP